MKAQLTTMLTKFEDMLVKAEDLAMSDNEKTAEKYDAVAAELHNIIENLTDAIGVFEDYK